MLIFSHCRITHILGVSQKRVNKLVAALTTDKNFGQYNYLTKKVRAGKVLVNVLLGKDLRVTPSGRELTLRLGHNPESDAAVSTTSVSAASDFVATPENIRPDSSSSSSSNKSKSNSKPWGGSTCDKEEEEKEILSGGGSTVGIQNMLFANEQKRHCRLLKYVEEVEAFLIVERLKL